MVSLHVPTYLPCRLCEKFRVHSHPEKADALEQLTEQFLNSKLERSFSHSDAHYGTLLLLLCVSDSPLHVDYLPTPKTPPAPGKCGTKQLTIYTYKYVHTIYACRDLWFLWLGQLSHGRNRISNLQWYRWGQLPYVHMYLWLCVGERESVGERERERERERDGLGKNYILPLYLQWSQVSESSSSDYSTRLPSPVHLSQSDDSAVGDELLEEISVEVPSLESQTKSKLLQQVTFPYWDSTNPDYQMHSHKFSIPSSSAHSSCSLASMW